MSSIQNYTNIKSGNEEQIVQTNSPKLGASEGGPSTVNERGWNLIDPFKVEDLKSPDYLPRASSLGWSDYRKLRGEFEGVLVLAKRHEIIENEESLWQLFALFLRAREAATPPPPSDLGLQFSRLSLHNEPPQEVTHEEFVRRLHLKAEEREAYPFVTESRAHHSFKSFAAFFFSSLERKELEQFWALLSADEKKGLLSDYTLNDLCFYGSADLLKYLLEGLTQADKMAVIDRAKGTHCGNLLATVWMENRPDLAEVIMSNLSERKKIESAREIEACDSPDLLFYTCENQNGEVLRQIINFFQAYDLPGDIHFLDRLKSVRVSPSRMESRNFLYEIFLREKDEAGLAFAKVAIETLDRQNLERLLLARMGNLFTPLDLLCVYAWPAEILGLIPEPIRERVLEKELTDDTARSRPAWRAIQCKKNPSQLDALLTGLDNREELKERILQKYAKRPG